MINNSNVLARNWVKFHVIQIYSTNDSLNSPTKTGSLIATKVKSQTRYTNYQDAHMALVHYKRIWAVCLLLSNIVKDMISLHSSNRSCVDLKQSICRVKWEKSRVTQIVCRVTRIVCRVKLMQNRVT